MARPFLSVVIPTYNEEARIRRTLDRITQYLATREYRWEVVVSDDGSTDGTSRLVEEAAAVNPNVRMLYLAHRGKGWAVKNGILAACGEYRLFCDADLAVPIEQVERLLPPRLQDVDVAVGSREQPESSRIGEPGTRRLMGRAFNWLVRAVALPGLNDTQCGFKCFRAEVVPLLFQRQHLDGFTFDTELLFLARKMGLTIQEVGVEWYYGDGSKVRPIKDSLSMTRDLFRIRRLHFKGSFSREHRQ